MKRTVVMLAVTALLMLAMAAPAFAVGNPLSNCVAIRASVANQLNPGSGGQDTRDLALVGDIGQRASSNCGQS